MRNLVLPVIVAGLLFAAPPARAQSASESTALAVQLFDDAERLVAEGKYAEACPKYAESYRLDPQLGALIYLAECLEKDGQLASAWGRYREAVDLASQRGDERASLAQERADKLAPRLSRLTIDVPADVRVPGLKVTRNGLELGVALYGQASAVDQASYRIEASAPGYETWTKEVVVAGEGSATSVAVPALVPSAPALEPTAPAPTAPQAPAPLAPPPPPPSRLTTPVIVSGVGTLVLGAGTLATGLLYISKRGQFNEINTAMNPDDDKKRGLHGEAQTLSTVATVLGVASGVGVALTTVLFIAAGPETETEPAIAILTPWVSSSGAGLMLEGAL